MLFQIKRYMNESEAKFTHLQERITQLENKPGNICAIIIEPGCSMKQLLKMKSYH